MKSPKLKSILIASVAFLLTTGCISISVDSSHHEKQQAQAKRATPFSTMVVKQSRDPEIIAPELQDIPIETPVYIAEQVDELIERNKCNCGTSTNGDNVIIWERLGAKVGADVCGAVVVGAESSVNGDCSISIGKWVASNGYRDFTAGFAVTNDSHHSIAIGKSIGTGFNNVGLNGAIEDGFGNVAINTKAWGAERGFIGTNTSYCLAALPGATIENDCHDSIAIGRDVSVATGVKYAVVIGNGSRATKDEQIIINGKDFTDVLERITALEQKVTALEQENARLTAQSVVSEQN